VRSDNLEQVVYITFEANEIVVDVPSSALVETYDMLLKVSLENYPEVSLTE